MQGNPLVNRIYRHGKARHLVVLIEQRMIGLGQAGINMQFFSRRKFTYGLVVNIQRPDTPVNEFAIGILL